MDGWMDGCHVAKLVLNFLFLSLVLSADLAGIWTGQGQDRQDGEWMWKIVANM
jgi:hypothetical protein